MFNNLNERDKKTIKMGAIAAAAIIVLLLALKGYSNWDNKRKEYDSLVSSINSLNISDAAQKKLLSDVPVFQLPQDEQTQKEDFRKELEREFDSLRIQTDPWQEVTTKKSYLSGYGTLFLKTSGSCRFQQILDLLAIIKDNPYLVGIEELHIECDPQNPQQANFNITVSTFTANKKGK